MKNSEEAELSDLSGWFIATIPGDSRSTKDGDGKGRKEELGFDDNGTGRVELKPIPRGRKSERRGCWFNGDEEEVEEELVALVAVGGATVADEFPPLPPERFPATLPGRVLVPYVISYLLLIISRGTLRSLAVKGSMKPSLKLPNMGRGK